MKLTTTVAKALGALSPTCRQAARLQSEAIDHPRSLLQRIGLRLHLLICKWCRRYAKQIHFLREAVHKHPAEHVSSAPQSLAPEARDRLMQLVRNQGK